MPFKIVAKSVLPAVPKSPIANVIVKISQGREAGNNLDFTDCIRVVNSGTPSSLEEKTFDLRILSPHFYPSISVPNITGAANKSIMQSLEELYNTLVGSAYDTTNFNRADLGKHVIIGEGFLCALDMIDRYIDTYNIKQYGNTGPDILCQGQTFKRTHSAGKVDFAELVAARNLLVPLINKLLVPSSIPWLQKHRYLVRHVFADDLHLKTGLIVPVIECLYARLVSGSNDVGLLPSSYYNPQSYQNDIIDFAYAVYTYLNDYIDSAFFKDISPYLWRAMLQENGPKVDKPYTVSERNDLIPNSNYDVIFDYRVIQMVRNADYIGIPFNLVSGNDGNMNIREDSAANLVQGVCVNNSGNAIEGVIIKPTGLVAPSGTTVSVPLNNMTFKQYALLANHWWGEEIIQCGAQNKYINVENWPSSDETLFYVINSKVLIRQYATGDTGTSCWKLWSTGDTVFTYLRAYLRDTDDPLYDNIEIKDFIPVMVNFYTAANKIMSRNSLTCRVDDMNENYVQLCTTSFLCCPNFVHIALRASTPQIKMDMQYIDKDNIVLVDADAINKAHGFTLYTAFLLHGTKEEKPIKKEEKPAK